nr:ribosomal protein S11 [Ophioglossum vulgatum]UTD44898.1 ribosomal protein S11 [Ophioglossum vulgatum]
MIRDSPFNHQKQPNYQQQPQTSHHQTEHLEGLRQQPSKHQQQPHHRKSHLKPLNQQPPIKQQPRCQQEWNNQKHQQPLVEHSEKQPRHLRQWRKHHQKLHRHHHQKQQPSKQHSIARTNPTLSNTLTTATDSRGKRKTGYSLGCLKGFKGSRRSTKYAAHATGEHVARAAIRLKIESVEARIKGIGLGRKKCSPKGSKEGGPITTKTRDVTPMPHNGCRPPKKRRV